MLIYLYFRQQHSFCQDSSQSVGSSASESDLMRQRFSVASHSRLPYLIVSDGYMITVLRFPNNLSPSGFIRTLLLDSTQRLESIRWNLLNSKVQLWIILAVFWKKKSMKMWNFLNWVPQFSVLWYLYEFLLIIKLFWE